MKLSIVYIHLRVVIVHCYSSYRRLDISPYFIFSFQSRKMGKHIMLSYQWDLQDLVKKVYESLCNRGLPVWMDIKGGISQDINDRFLLLLLYSFFVPNEICGSYAFHAVVKPLGCMGRGDIWVTFFDFGAYEVPSWTNTDAYEDWK